MNEDLLERLRDMGAEVDDTLARMMDDEDMYVEYLKKFRKNENILELRKAVEAGDCEKADREVHSLKGVALNLGLIPLVDVCMDMRMDFMDGNNEAAMAQIGNVERCFQEWVDAIGE